MPDIALRLNRDMLVLSAPIESALARQGADAEQDMEYLLINEPEAIEDELRFEQSAGAQVLVAPTASCTEARLARHRMEESGADVVRAAYEAAAGLKPQHILAELGPCGLPLDPSSQSSLKEIRGQYARALELFSAEPFDAAFANGFVRIEDFRCVLEAAAERGDSVFASVRLDDEGNLPYGGGKASLEDAAAAARELGAAAFGFETAGDAEAAARLVRRAKEASGLPIIVQFHVNAVEPKVAEPLPQNPYPRADLMVGAAAHAYAAGAQFLRATGAATPAYTGALMATVSGLDVKLH